MFKHDYFDSTCTLPVCLIGDDTEYSICIDSILPEHLFSISLYLSLTVKLFSIDLSLCLLVLILYVCLFPVCLSVGMFVLINMCMFLSLLLTMFVSMINERFPRYISYQPFCIITMNVTQSEKYIILQCCYC